MFKELRQKLIGYQKSDIKIKSRHLLVFRIIQTRRIVGRK